MSNQKLYMIVNIYDEAPDARSKSVFFVEQTDHTQKLFDRIRNALQRDGPVTMAIRCALTESAAKEKRDHTSNGTWKIIKSGIVECSQINDRIYDCIATNALPAHTEHADILLNGKWFNDLPLVEEAVVEESTPVPEPIIVKSVVNPQIKFFGIIVRRKNSTEERETSVFFIESTTFTKMMFELLIPTINSFGKFIIEFTDEFTDSEVNVAIFTLKFTENSHNIKIAYRVYRDYIQYIQLIKCIDNPSNEKLCLDLLAADWFTLGLNPTTFGKKIEQKIK